jgi:hypothetical protein
MGREIRVCVYWSLCGASVRMRGIRSPPDMQSLKSAYDSWPSWHHTPSTPPSPPSSPISPLSSRPFNLHPLACLTSPPPCVFHGTGHLSPESSPPHHMALDNTSSWWSRITTSRLAKLSFSFAYTSCSV